MERVAGFGSRGGSMGTSRERAGGAEEGPGLKDPWGPDGTKARVQVLHDTNKRVECLDDGLILSRGRLVSWLRSPSHRSLFPLSRQVVGFSLPFTCRQEGPPVAVGSAVGEALVRAGGGLSKTSWAS